MAEVENTPQSLATAAVTEASHDAEIHPESAPKSDAPDPGEPTARLVEPAAAFGEHVETYEEAKAREQVLTDHGRAVVPPASLGDATANLASPAGPILESTAIAANPGSVISTKNPASKMLEAGGLTHEQIDETPHADLRAVAEAHGWREVVDGARGAVRALFKKAQAKAIEELKIAEAELAKL